MPIKDQYPGGAIEKQWVRIVTVDTRSRRIDAQLKDFGIIQVALYDVPTAFRWPKEGEMWTVVRENGDWFLRNPAQAPDATFTIEKLNAGDTFIGHVQAKIRLVGTVRGTDFLVAGDSPTGAGHTTGPESAPSSGYFGLGGTLELVGDFRYNEVVVSSGALKGSSGTPSGSNRFVTEVDSRLLSQAQKDALGGTNGTPSSTNKFVTDADPRNSNARTPTVHRTTHEPGGGDSPRTHGFWLFQSGGGLQTITNGAVTAMTWPSENLDVGDNHSNVVNNHLVLLPYAGWWLFSVVVIWDANTTGVRYLQLGGSIDGATVSIGTDRRTASTDGFTDQTVTSAYLLGGSSRYVFVNAYHTKGSNLTLTAAEFRGIYLGDTL